MNDCYFGIWCRANPVKGGGSPKKNSATSLGPIVVMDWGVVWVSCLGVGD